MLACILWRFDDRGSTCAARLRLLFFSMLAMLMHKQYPPIIQVCIFLECTFDSDKI